MLDLWLHPVGQASVQWAQAHSAVLDEEERRRRQRYLSSESQAQFVVAHVVTRYVLSIVGDREPTTWRFDRGPNGRPEIVDGPDGLRFNISHTNGMVAVLVHGQSDCGVDVESLRRPVDMRSVARTVFTDAEQDSIFSQSPEQQAARFYRLWTLKEALIKANGKGFALPLRNFSFTIRDGQDSAGSPILLACDAAVELTPNEWQFFTQRFDTGHIVSIAAHRGAGVPAAPVLVHQFDIESLD